MKRTLACVLAVACIVFCASVGLAANYDISKIDTKRMDFINSLHKLADQIVAHNKHTFEAQFNFKDDETRKTYVAWDRVWAKDKTIVTAQAGKEKKFFSTSLVTADPNMVFAGGIHVGASTAVLEKFFKGSLSQISYRPGVIYSPCGSDYDAESFYIFYDNNGKITEIYAQWGFFDMLPSEKATQFIGEMRKQLGFPNSNLELLK